MIARQVVGSDVCASGGVGVEVWSGVAYMALPFVRRWWRLSARHSSCNEIGEIEC